MIATADDPIEDRGPHVNGGDLIEARRERPSDIDAIRTVVEAAFPTNAEAKLVEALRVAGEVAVSVVAVERDVVLGHAMLSKMSGPFPIVGLAPVSVRPERQRQGIGQLLVSQALELARDDGWVAAFVIGSPRYYERFGFSVDLAQGFQSPYAGAHFMALVLGDGLPTRSGRVDYASAFAELG